MSIGAGGCLAHIFLNVSAVFAAMLSSGQITQTAALASPSLNFAYTRLRILLGFSSRLERLQLNCKLFNVCQIQKYERERTKSKIKVTFN